MALDQSALLSLLDALRSSENGDLVRSLAERLLQELIEAEATAHFGAGPNERAETRTAQRNGHRPKTLTTAAGDLDLRIPKLRAGSFFPSLLERRRRIDRALFAVVMEAYLHGVSTRSVDDLVVAMGASTGISKSEVSRICQNLDEEVAAFRDRSLSHIAFPYVYLDATYCKTRVDHRIVSQAVVIATGISADGRREVLGFAVGDSEDTAFWTEFLRSLRQRGLSGVKAACSRNGVIPVSMPIYCAGMNLNLRSSARAIILDENDRILLCRFVFPHPAVPGPEKAVWAAPGGGIEPGKDRLTALRSELREEIGLAITADPPRIWQQIVVAADHAPGFDGIINDYFLVRTNHFEPRGELTDHQLAAEENLAAFRWWQLPQIASNTGPDLFSPHDLATPLAEQLTTGTPTEPTQLGL